MANKSKKKGPGGSTIALNKKATHDYFIEERFEAGIALQGWEVKSLRQGRIQIKERYITIKDGEAFLFGAHIVPLSTASTHIELFQNFGIFRAIKFQLFQILIKNAQGF